MVSAGPIPTAKPLGSAAGGVAPLYIISPLLPGTSPLGLPWPCQDSIGWPEDAVRPRAAT